MGIHTRRYIGYSSVVSGTHPSHVAFAPVSPQGLPVRPGQRLLPNFRRYVVHRSPPSRPSKRLDVVQEVKSKKKLTCPCGTEQILHHLLSSGLGFLTEHINYWGVVEIIRGSNQKYAGLQLWFATDLDLAIVSSAIPPQIRNSDDAKLVIRQGPIYDGCGWRLPWRAKQHLPIDRSAVHGQH